jgi:hypothetical protein
MDFISMLCLTLTLVGGVILVGVVWLVGVFFIITVGAAIDAWRRTR